MSADPVWLACAAMVGLTAAVAVRMYVERLGEMRQRRIAPQSLASSADAARQLTQTRAADNFRNLFEVPVLFYAWCVAVAVTGGSTPALLAAAWAFVALRALHSLIHLSYNRVVHRFAAYLAGTLLLFAMWVAILPRLL